MYIAEHGYVVVRIPGHPLADARGWVYQHRAVAWDAGILTNPDEIVHHLNGNKQDNRAENLEAITASEHQRLHDVLGAIHRVKTHCPRGHPYDERNTRWYRGRRWCRACDSARGRAKRRALRKGAVGR